MKKILFLLTFLFAINFTQAQTIFISEIHYDNVGTDTLEGIEIAGPAGTDLSCFELQLYNGGLTSITNDVYMTIPLTGTIDDEGAGYGAVWFDAVGLQNGAPDGIALVSTGATGCPAAGVIQFISYEGVMLGADVQGGSAAGMTSVDIGVAELGSPSGESLQLQGSGTTYGDFVWADSMAMSMGTINMGMSFGAPTTGNICGVVYEDYNNNDTLNTGELGYAGAVVYALSAGPDGTMNTADDIIVDTTTTNSTGSYCFAGLWPGSYQILVDSIPTFASTYSSAVLAVVAGSNFSNINISLHATTPTIPELHFTTSSLTFAENAGTISINVAINMPNSNPTSVDVALGTSTATSGTDFTFTSPTTVTFPAGSAVTQVVNLTIIDDAITSEGIENLILTLSNPTNGAVLIADSVITINITDNDLTLSTIASMTNENPDGTAISSGTAALLEGVVYGTNLRASTTGTQFTIIDNTGGIGVFDNANTYGYTVTEGDLVSITGTIVQFNGLTQINPDTIIKISSGNPLKTPTVVSTLNEITESDLVELSTDCWMILNPTTWNPATNPLGFNINLSNGTDTVQLRIDNDVDIFTTLTTAPTGVSVKGIGGQYDSSNPYTSGYQITPRYMADISTCVGIEEVETIQHLAPNPTADHFQISTTAEIQDIHIYDMQGKKIASYLQVGTMQKMIDASTWTPGLYMLYVRTDAGYQSTKIIIE